MNESVFKEILGDALKSGLAEFDNVPEHKFSLKHRIAMKRIFSRFERNVRKPRAYEHAEPLIKDEHKTRLNFRQRLLISLLVIILMSFLVGWIAVFVSEKFHGTVYSDNTELIAVDIAGSPTTIEHKYVPVSIPEGFELVKTDSSPFDVYARYKNNHTGQGITFCQYTKAIYKPHLNTEHYRIEEIMINDKSGLYIDFSDQDNNHTLLVWDNGDYILEISADLDKTEALNLANFNKF